MPTTVFADAPSPRYGCVLYVTHIAAVNWVLNCALTDGAAFVLFGAKIAAGGAQKAKMVMMWVERWQVWSYFSIKLASCSGTE